ncbi:UDP-2,3-diacylglucosamine hydrolase lpxH [Candidatus Kinetoplastibacterium blastocrithidii TCC012E]|uniref:UDP-2,3-diacylglucosamine hydrolase n=1 Tax=Candidatus Kinetoplastidibacterium blastocrithidiae TCC012E TaxID=1208922 RepID=M1LAV1_9PROT|nr:UDP-2,3-diacylglucosamine diphosphatase [Candidatus Kinetoplastibacterium blastocrithidii]AFZ83506.1 UDP-2,3-diacylglucosamine hydrolase [Candidatus Kinetoplastibacterium blastocrithidii (ex Strigomonas culicis)]AGF49603.1 UDP-2,3-diacylglucosamine hydrolase lpxH [Candidatus Kinetoplastibacterium blastocrithidii TCC012E]
MFHRLKTYGDTWLASDFHLSEHTLKTSKAFKKLLAIASASSSNLILLGDIFDAWIGDDLIEKNKPCWLINILKSIKIASSYINIYILPGNRDFLLGENFSNISGAYLITEPQTILENDHQEILISHGDELCIDDIEYQKYRTMVRSDNWKNFFLQKNLFERSIIAKKIREYSKMANQKKSEEIANVTESEVKKNFENICCPSKMIHGHTHVKKKHTYIVKNRICERWVLPDWNYDSTEKDKGGWIVVKNDKIDYCSF